MSEKNYKEEERGYPEVSIFTVKSEDNYGDDQLGGGLNVLVY